MKQYLAKVIAGEPLSEAEAHEAMNTIMSGEATPAQIAGFLVALRMRGEKAHEIASFARAMSEKAIRIQAPDGTIDTCGTGGDQAHTLNLSTAAALVVASLGVPVAKHGNRAVSSASGSADVVASLGIPIENPPEKAQALLHQKGFAFLFAPLYHPAMKFAIGPRRELGVRTVFNILGPLSSPAGVKRQVIGVFSEDWLQPLARALVALGRERALVVHGEPGLDEVSTCGRTRYAMCQKGSISEGEFSTDTLGCEQTPLDTLKVTSADESAARIRAAFDNRDTTASTAIAANAGVALWVADKARSPREGVLMATAALKNGTAARFLEKLRQHPTETG